MNKFSLDENQLRRVKYFIWQKRIQDADAINEVLDHFACKVEELMNEDMNLPLDKAMQAAYFSFGKDGFKTIVEQYRKQIASIFWREFRIVSKEMLGGKLFILGTVFCIIYGVALQYLLVNHIENWAESAFIYSAFIAILGSIMYRALSFWKSEKKNDFFFSERKNLNQWQKTAQKMPRIDSFNILFIALFGILKFDGLSFIYGLMCLGFFSLLNDVARKETRKRMSLKLSI